MAAEIPIIVCFGDSLTWGYQRSSTGPDPILQTPYGRRLQSLVGQRALVKVSGINGEVTEHMMGRFHRDVVAAGADFVVILGGSNDLGHSVEPARVLENLASLYRQAGAANVTPVAVSVPSLLLPEVDPTWLAGHLQARATLNHGLRAHCAAESIAFVDVHAATSDPQTQLLQSRYSNDGLHLTTAGYDRLADLLFGDFFDAGLAGG